VLTLSDLCPADKTLWSLQGNRTDTSLAYADTTAGRDESKVICKWLVASFAFNLRLFFGHSKEVTIERALLGRQSFLLRDLRLLWVDIDHSRRCKRQSLYDDEGLRLDKLGRWKDLTPAYIVPENDAFKSKV